VFSPFFFLKSFHAGEEKREVVAMDKIMFLKSMVFFFLDVRVYFATFTFPGKRTWLRFWEI